MTTNSNVQEEFFDAIVVNNVVKSDHNRQIRVEDGNRVYGAKSIDVDSKLLYCWEFEVRCQYAGAIAIGLVQRSGSGSCRRAPMQYLFDCHETDIADDVKQQDTIIMTLECSTSTLTFNRNGQDVGAMNVDPKSNGYRMCVCIRSNGQKVKLSSYSEKSEKKQVKGWSSDEELFLWSNKNQLSMKEIAEKLDRTESACDQKLRKLKSKWKNRWCEKCDKLFGTDESLTMHNVEVHSNQVEKQPRPDPVPEDPLPSAENKPQDRWCAKCDRLFDTAKGLTIHNGKVHSNKRPRPEPLPEDPEPDGKKRKVVKPTPTKSDTETSASNAHKLEWTKKQVSKWLCSLGSDYDAYAPKFESSGISGRVLNGLDEGGLEEIVTSKLHRNIITSEWNAL